MCDLKDYLPFDTWIAKKHLTVGSTYFCKARNFKYGVWNGESFNYMRTKCGSEFPDVEYHWDDGSPHGTVKPLEEVDG